MCRLFAGSRAPGGLPETNAALFLMRPKEPPPPNSFRLQISFGMTPAETRLADLLAYGKSLKDIGEHLHLGRETLKSQLRSLFKKTGTHRQGELIALFLSSLSISMT